MTSSDHVTPGLANQASEQASLTEKASGDAAPTIQSPENMEAGTIPSKSTECTTVEQGTLQGTLVSNGAGSTAGESGEGTAV